MRLGVVPRPTKDEIELTDSDDEETYIVVPFNDDVEV